MGFAGGSSAGGGENINHYGVIRMRLSGAGSLQMSLIGLDNATLQTLVPFTMATSPGREVLRLSNFTGQRAKLNLITTEKDEIFKINRIIIFIKPIYSEYPA